MVTFCESLNTNVVYTVCFGGCPAYRAFEVHESFTVSVCIYVNTVIGVGFNRNIYCFAIGYKFNNDREVTAGCECYFVGKFYGVIAGSFNCGCPRGGEGTCSGISIVCSKVSVNVYIKGYIRVKGVC